MGGATLVGLSGVAVQPMDPDRDELAVRALGQYYGLIPAFT
jgi:hypothetical protein